MTQAPNNGNRNPRLITSILIEPFRQIKFGVYVIAICVAFIAAAGWLFVDSFIQQYNHVMEVFHVVDPELRNEFIIDEIFVKNAIRLIAVFAIFLILLFVTIFRLTHRYYGPLVSIERFLDQISRGEYNARVTIRSKDELQNLVKKLNYLAEELEKRHGRH